MGTVCFMLNCYDFLPAKRDQALDKTITIQLDRQKPTQNRKTVLELIQNWSKCKLDMTKPRYRTLRSKLPK